MRKTLGVCLLILLMTCSAGAGEMPNLQPAPPPPSQTASVVQEPAGEETLNDIIQTPDVSESMTQIALDLLALLPSLL